MHEVIKYDITDAALDKLQEKYAEVPDVNSKEGYEAVKSGIREVRKLRTSVEKKRKELKADALEYGRRVDAEAKRITDALLSIEEPMKEAKQEFDAKKEAEKQAKIRAEEERKQKIEDKIAAIKNSPVACVSASSEDIETQIKALEGIDVTVEEYEEYHPVAAAAKVEAVAHLKQLYDEAVRRETEDRLRAEEEERLAKEKAEFEQQRAAEEKKRKEEQAKIDAENERLRKEKEKLEAEQRAEEERKAKEAEEKRLAEERKKQEEADKKLQKKKRGESLSGINEIVGDLEVSGNLLDAIVAGKIPNVRWE
jgi:hypothetical protein